MEDYESLCQICGNVYNRNKDSIEIKESGEYICSECWDKDE